MTTESDAGSADKVNDEEEEEEEEEGDDEDVSKYMLDSDDEVWSVAVLIYRVQLK